MVKKLHMKENNKVESISKPENKFINDWASSLSMFIPTDDRDVIKYQNKSSRKSAFNQLEHIVWRLPIYSSLMAEIHERSVAISTTDDPYEFENHYYTLVMNKLLDIILNDMIPFKESPSTTNNNRKSDRKMVRKIKESANYNIDANKLAKQVNNAINDAVTYVDSGKAYPTWHWLLASDDDYDYELVLGFSAGFEPNEYDFTDSNGDGLCLKWARISKRSAMNDYDMDYEMPYDEKTGDVWDSEITITDDILHVDVTDDVKWLVKDFEKYADKNLGVKEACGKKIRKEAFDPNKLEKTAKTNKRDFAEIISNELADMDWRDYVDGNYDTEDEAWEAFVDMTYQTLLKEPETIVDYLEDIDTAKSEELIKLINKYYINGTKESFRRPSKKK